MNSQRLHDQWLLLFVMLLLTPTAYAAQLKLVADDWPPFTSDKPGQKIAVDLVEHALKRSGITAQTKIIQWNNVLEGVKADKYDAIVGAWKNFEREQYLLFSRAYLENRIMLVGRTDNKIKFSDVTQLENKKIGTVRGYAYGESFINNKKIVKVSSPNVTDSLKKLLNKEVDFILTDSIVARSMKQDLPQDVKNQLVIYNKVVLANKLFFAIRKNYPDAKTIIEKFNQSIRNMISDGSYNRILGFEWLVADTDGDGVEEYIVGDLAPSTTADPASSDDSYPVFSKQENTDKKRPKKYRVLNLEYNSWNEAEQAIQKARISGSLQYEDKETGAVNIFSGKF